MLFTFTLLISKCSIILLWFYVCCLHLMRGCRHQGRQHVYAVWQWTICCSDWFNYRGHCQLNSFNYTTNTKWNSYLSITRELVINFLLFSAAIWIHFIYACVCDTYLLRESSANSFSIFVLIFSIIICTEPLTILIGQVLEETSFLNIVICYQILRHTWLLYLISQ